MGRLGNMFNVINMLTAIKDAQYASLYSTVLMDYISRTLFD